MDNCSEETEQKVVKTSKDLLLSEYITGGEHVLNKLEKKDKGKLKTFPMKCTALSKVKELLPRMLEAQNSLKEKSDAELNIENVEGCDEVIEMNIAVYEETSSDSESGDNTSESEEETTFKSKPLIEVMKEI